MMKNRRSFIVGLKTTILLDKEVKFLKRFKPWGVILFSRNIRSFNQTKKLTHNIKKIFKDKKYPILIDQEGGRVDRLNNLINSSIFSGNYFGKLFKEDKKKFNNYYYLFIKQTSYLLKNLGININSVPVLDLKRKNAHNIIGDRSFDSNPKIVSKIGDICINLFHKNNIGTIIKHIPGHGLAKLDSHKSTPVISNKLSYLIDNDFYPFKKKKSFFAMTAHIIYKDIDPKFTATHSKKIISLIRNKIQFKNILISDDISMKSLKYSLKKNIINAFDSGCDLVLHCNGKLPEMIKVAENSPKINKFIIKKTSQFYKILS
jgi:beta-N-acetylhexosaminidase